jgi:hypothetical protein
VKTSPSHSFQPVSLGLLDFLTVRTPTVAGRGEDGALNAVTQFAQLIDDLARRVEAAFGTAGNTKETAATG